MKIVQQVSWFRVNSCTSNIVILCTHYTDVTDVFN